MIKRIIVIQRLFIQTPPAPLALERRGDPCRAHQPGTVAPKINDPVIRYVLQLLQVQRTAAVLVNRTTNVHVWAKTPAPAVGVEFVACAAGRYCVLAISLPVGFGAVVDTGVGAASGEVFVIGHVGDCGSCERGDEVVGAGVQLGARAVGEAFVALGEDEDEEVREEKEEGHSDDQHCECW